ncbi:hypothetical protein L5515_016768 [Caenorhabditis briggsae]|uniref:G-protein coupled receptors family 1 profile domain-containing protein n=1 Tax=Caenorhabditis briggsae TaxID=6238 RepID=A0AAE9JQM5_CAEBR|nr:hypothetical protein L5515_016768 [Caenorhabditis briggsae]
MARAVNISPFASYTVVPITSAWPPDDDPQTTRVQFSGLTSGKAVLTLIILAMMMMTIVGNALVFLAVLIVRKLKTPQNFLLVSLAVADFFVGLVVMPLALIDLLFDKWPLGSTMCSVYTTADLTLCTASIVNLCAISVDRYLVISRPLQYSAIRTTRRIGWYIACVWITAAVVSISSHIIARFLDDGTFIEDPGTCQVLPHFLYQSYATLISFYGPTFIMVILNIKIWREAKRLAAQDRLMSHCNSVDASERPLNGGSSSSENKESTQEKETIEVPKKERTNSTNSRLFKLERKYLHRPSTFFSTAAKGPLIRQNERSECKARKTLGVIMSVFIICWLPFFILAIFKSFGMKIPGWLDLTALWLGYSNSTVNPLIYCKYNKEFRIPFREMLACRCATLQTVMRQQSFTSRYGPPVSRRNDSHEASDV